MHSPYSVITLSRSLFSLRAASLLQKIMRLSSIVTFVGNSPIIESAAMVFPEPVSPMSATLSPEDTEKCTSESRILLDRSSFALIFPLE